MRDDRFGGRRVAPRGNSGRPNLLLWNRVPSRLPRQPGRVFVVSEPSVADLLPDVERLRVELDKVDYLADEGTVTALFCAARLPQPVLIEGEPGVGKTQSAKALAEVLRTPLVRLQCYDGIDVAEAVYEWNYPRQLLSIRLAESRGESLAESDVFGPGFL